jgi:hypothetical protein
MMPRHADPAPWILLSTICETLLACALAQITLPEYKLFVKPHSFVLFRLHAYAMTVSIKIISASAFTAMSNDIHSRKLLYFIVGRKGLNNPELSSKPSKHNNGLLTLSHYHTRGMSA